MPNSPNPAQSTDIYQSSCVNRYTWELGDVSGYDPNTWPGGDPNYYFELTVQVNTHAEPMGTLYNKVTAESEYSYVDAHETTRVDCWGGNIIYVDKYAPGPHIGTTWETAYLNLTDALARTDIGADEVACMDTWNENDWTFDGITEIVKSNETAPTKN